LCGYCGGCINDECECPYCVPCCPRRDADERGNEDDEYDGYEHIPYDDVPVGPWDGDGGGRSPWRWLLLLLLLPLLFLLFFLRRVEVTFHSGKENEDPHVVKMRRCKKVDRPAPETFGEVGPLIEDWYLNGKFQANNKWDFSEKVRKDLDLYAKMTQSSDNIQSFLKDKNNDK